MIGWSLRFQYWNPVDRLAKESNPEHGANRLLSLEVVVVDVVVIVDVVVVVVDVVVVVVDVVVASSK